jgi:hypothetical protein
MQDARRNIRHAEDIPECRHVSIQPAQLYKQIMEKATAGEKMPQYRGTRLAIEKRRHNNLHAAFCKWWVLTDKRAIQKHGNDRNRLLPFASLPGSGNTGSKQTFLNKPRSGTACYTGSITAYAGDKQPGTHCPGIMRSSCMFISSQIRITSSRPESAYWRTG